MSNAQQRAWHRRLALHCYDRVNRGEIGLLPRAWRYAFDCDPAPHLPGAVIAGLNDMLKPYGQYVRSRVMKGHAPVLCSVWLVVSSRQTPDWDKFQLGPDDCRLWVHDYAHGYYEQLRWHYQLNQAVSLLSLPCYNETTWDEVLGYGAGIYIAKAASLWSQTEWRYLLEHAEQRNPVWRQRLAELENFIASRLLLLKIMPEHPAHQAYQPLYGINQQIMSWKALQ